VKTGSASCEAVICLQLAATLTCDTYDKVSSLIFDTIISLLVKHNLEYLLMLNSIFQASTTRLSGLSASKYRSQYQALSSVLGVQKKIKIHDLAISHGVMTAETLAKEVLSQYTKDVQVKPFII